ncbi:interleukin-17D-like [Lytechinus variegatus]|uniref:interleukin-17D-like n=1 Tax=Lytechinus variegatus TaxID=7654 RepID=UPI001BB1A5BB|nr:interleukin-17D-like [Lytechinus variegatus]
MKICLVIVALVHAVTSSPVSASSSSSSSSPYCLPMNQADYESRERNGHLFYPNQDAFAVQSFNISDVDMGREETSSCPYDGLSSAKSCPNGAEPSASEPTNANQDGMCPWTYVECFDPDRIPMSISMAQCQCSACLDPYTHMADPNLRCQPIFHNMKVLRKTQCVDGLFRYEEETVNIPVACACMRQRVA